ncbi:ORF6C domain-containing protein [Clostridium tertium]|uniref:ORF6C domain-containing protein n=1 Tax=Clostridium tertium TaxID=1559 RepID=UPI0018AB50F8|nr:ORF6C domain-containing protein [Clostridium tertium]
MNNLIKINGLKEIAGMKFHDIEGGFGENKKAMLVKELASIHGRELKAINQSINMNKERFKDGIDIIDLKGTVFAVNLIDSGIYSQNSLNASNNVYLLSERGYAKLLKILEDDVAWEQYEKLVDGYFNMRGQTINIPKLSKELQAILMLDEKTVEMDNRITTLEERMTIETGAQKVLQDLVNKKVMAILGGKDSPAYKELGNKTFRQCWKNFKDILQVASYKDTPVKDFDLAKKTIIDWQPNRELELMIMGCNAQMRM